MTDIAPEVRDSVVLAELDGGKTIQFVRQGRVAKIRLSGGGKLPEVLEGGWTDVKNAQSAVDSYLAGKKSK